MTQSGCSSVVFFLLTGIAVLALIPTTVLVLEIVAALLPPDQVKGKTGLSPSMVILVPAHDEAAQIEATVLALKKELGPRDRLIVVADNCEDATASLAREAGAQVIERIDASHLGKGFAISYAVSYLESFPPDVVVLVDADCQIERGRLASLADLAQQYGVPIQSDYLLTAPPTSGRLASINAFAVLVRNRVRLLGLQRLAGVCHLTGSGMAVPWSILRAAPSAKENLVEDLVIGLELALAGFPPRFCSEVRLASVLPQGSKAGLGQRRRWEHGQLCAMRRYVPRMLTAFLRKPSRAPMGLALDLMVPPLALLVVLELAALGLTSAAAALRVTSALPFLLASSSFALLLLAIASSWFAFGRSTLPWSTALRIPAYVLWKIGIYGSLVVKGKQKTWVRTARDPEAGHSSSPMEASTRAEELVASGTCGVYCHACSLYVESGDRPEGLGGFAKGLGSSIGEVGCHGCRSNLRASLCSTCKLRACAQSRNVVFCTDCCEFPCAEFCAFAAGKGDHAIVAATKALRSHLMTDCQTIKEKGWRHWYAQKAAKAKTSPSDGRV
jgi:cellulose synthase/poly-beta-1,6-N-acetylglucosamine synthase-like glycosyltransferase